MSSSDLYGDVLERQRRAFESPIWRVAQAQDELFRHQHQLPTGLWLQSVLTVDCYDKPWAWHCAVGLLRVIGQPANEMMKTARLKAEMFKAEAIPLTTWSQAEYQLAISTARALLAGVGKAQEVSWTNAAVFPLTLQAWRDLSPDELANVEAKMAEVRGIAGFQFTDRERLSPIVMPASVAGH